MLIAPSRLKCYFPDSIDPLPYRLVEDLRRELTRLDSERAGSEEARAFVETVLEKVCGLNCGSGGSWQAGGNVDQRWSHKAITGEVVRPRRIWNGPHGSALPVFVDTEKRLGVGRGRRAVSRVVEWLRLTGQPVALLTNHRQWRLVYAGLDHEAWAEWDSERWFEEGRPGPQVDALRALLSPKALTPPEEGKAPPLLEAIAESRKGQAELSASLGERVRQAVELLIQSYGPALETAGDSFTHRDTYVAACRMVMRLVVTLFAEARDLLPRDNPLYHGSYGLQGLREYLERAGGTSAAERLRHQHGAWARVLGLFRLIYEGSHHEDLMVQRYGGGLFAPGDPAGADSILRAIAVFEDRERAPNDYIVAQILKLICRCKVKIRQGRASTFVDAPVDFSDLSTEYIGILYEGLLDFELRRADTAEPVVFLNVGDQPALPLGRLEAMEDSALKALLEKLKKSNQKLAASDEGGEDEEAEGEDEEGGEEEQEEAEGQEEEEAEPTESEEEATESDGDARREASARAQAWATRAVQAAGLVRRPRGRSRDAQAQFEQQAAEAGKKLLARMILPGEWYLVRWGGTRKGSGTFYTRPGLAVPTVHRTLRPLAYTAPKGPKGEPNEDAPPSEWTPRKPEEIVALKTCDAAMGSGSFLVATARFLTEALSASLFAHGWVRRTKQDQIEAPGLESRPDWFQDLVRGMPGEAEDAEQYLRARLKRVVVEHCIYGVDHDPLAVELARLALWVETMDRDLAFEFLDHKLKCGNALVGCWFDRFRDYPIMAWSREGGDKSHSNGVHFEKNAWTKAIKEHRKNRALPMLADAIRNQKSLYELIGGETPEKAHEELTGLFAKLHKISVLQPDAQAVFYREKVEGHPALKRLRQAFDVWCSVWFWPPDELSKAPLADDFKAPLEHTLKIAAGLAQELRFFHWELEFPDVFASKGAGFDAVLGNPPWEIQKPNSKEYFSNLDPLYRTYGKQDAKNVQTEIFQRAKGEERAWLEYNARLKALSNWCKYAGEPFGDGEGLGRGFPGDLWQSRRAKRKGFADPDHPFRHQGSADINTYKMFLELKHALLRDGGILGVIVPSGVYTDKGSTALRQLFLTRCRWKWLFGFENKQGIFDIHRSFKFGPVIVQKGGSTEAIRTAFMRHDLSDWARAEALAVPYTRKQVERFSPNTRAILEIRHQRDLEVLEKIYANSVLLGDQGPDGWGIKYATEFHMTNDSHLFKPRPWWEEQGYRPDEYGRWLKGKWRPAEGARWKNEKGAVATLFLPPDGGPHRWIERPAGVILSRDGQHWIAEDEIEDTALPLYQGVMIRPFDFCAAAHREGAGNRAEWQVLEWEQKAIIPQFLVARSDIISNQTERSENNVAQFRLAFRDMTNSTNSRTLIAALIPMYPCGNKAPLLTSPKKDLLACLVVVLDSFVLDQVLRIKFSTSAGAGSLNPFILFELPAPKPISAKMVQFIHAVNLVLSLPAEVFAPTWITFGALLKLPFKKRWAVSLHERLRCRCILDAFVAECFGLEVLDLAWILRDCDHPLEPMRTNGFTRMLDPKGFWRVDKEKDPELRHTVLTLAAFHDLQETIRTHSGDREKGIAAFCNQNDGEGWMLPETLCLADLGLGHDERAKKPQPVRERLGPRFLPWQFEQSAEDSWKECELHARNILGEEGFKRLQAELRGDAPRANAPTAGVGNSGDEFTLTPGGSRKRGRKKNEANGQHRLF